MTKILNEIRQHGSLFSPKNQGKDVLKFAIPPGEEFFSSRITILDARFGGSATFESIPPVGKVGKSEIKVAWQGEGLADVKYQVEAFSKAKNSEVAVGSITRQMTGFLPSQNGWPFDNRFAKVPPFKLIGEIKFGDASNGLCGGMVYAAMDYFVAGLDIPKIPDEDLSKFKSPKQGPIFDYFGKRLFNSFDIPTGVWNYIELMHPDFPDYMTSNSSYVGGAAAGALIGQIADDDAGKGAAYGAAAGAGMARRGAKRGAKGATAKAESQGAQAQQATKEQIDAFKKAFSACLGAKNYMVKF